MKRKTLTAIAAALSLGLAAVAPAMAQTPDPTTTPAAPTQQSSSNQQQSTLEPTQVPLTSTTQLFVNTEFTVNVRSGPGTQYTILGQVRQVDALDVTGRLADGTWLRVNFNGQEGWVLASLFNVTGDVTTAPEAVAGSSAVLRNGASTTGATNSQSGEVMGTTRGSVNLRSIPSTQGEVLAVIPFDTELVPTGRVSANNWIQVSYNNQTGWISSGFFFFSRGLIGNLPVFDESGVAIPVTAQPAAQPTSQPQATAQPTSQPTAQQSTSTPQPTATNAP